MNPADFTTVSYKFKLYDTLGGQVESQMVQMEYLDESTQEWTSFHRLRVMDSDFLFEEEINPPVGTPRSIFLQENHIPELRLVAIPSIYSSPKPEVVAFTCQLTKDEVAGTLEFDFGTCYLVEPAELSTADVFPGFIIVTSPFLSTNQSANLALIEELEDTVLELESDIETLNTTITELTADVAERDATIAGLNTTITGLNATIDELTTDIADRDATIATLNTTITDLNEDIADRDATIATLNTTITDLNEEIAEKDATIAALNTTITELNAAAALKDSLIASLNAQLTAALLDVQEQTLKVTRLEELNDELEATAVDKQEQIEILQEQIDVDNTPVRVSEFSQQLVQEIGSSAKSLDGGSGYKLANISLKLKTVVSRDAEGVNVQLVDLSGMNQVNGDAVSELTFDIVPEPIASSVGGSIPNLLGLTETAVRRILTSLELKLNPVFQNNTAVVNGDSFKQSPEAGSTYNVNDTVTVIFSKHE